MRIKKVGLYKYLLVMRITLADILEYRLENLFRVFRYVAIVSFMLLLWLAINRESSLIDLDINQLVTYYLLAMIIYGVSNYHTFYIENDIRLGMVSNYLTKPFSAFGRYFTYQGTITIYDLLIKLVVFAPLLWWIGYQAPSLLALGLTLLLLIAGYFVTFNLYFAFSVLAFWFAQVESLRMSSMFLGRYLSGILIPFFLFPERAQALLWWTPFPHYAYTPISLASGQLSLGRGAQGLVIALLWGVLFLVINQLIWAKATRAYEGTGI